MRFNTKTNPAHFLAQQNVFIDRSTANGETSAGYRRVQMVHPKLASDSPIDRRYGGVSPSSPIRRRIAAHRR